MSNATWLQPNPVARVALCLSLAAFGCGDDDDVGGTSNGTDAGDSTAGTTTDDPSTTDASDPTSDPTDTEGETNGGTTTEGETEDDPTTEGETEGDTGADCEGLGNRECTDTDGCMWFGTPEGGFCADEDGGGIEVCDSLGTQQQCNVAPGCMWDMDTETCVAVGCEGLPQGQCTLAPDCEWDATEMVCMDA